MPKIIDYQTYEQTLNALNLRYIVLWLAISFIVVVSIFIGHYFRYMKISKSTEEFEKIDFKHEIGNSSIISVVLVLATFMVVLLISLLHVSRVEVRTMEASNVVYSWKEKNTFLLDEFNVSLKKEIGENFSLTITAKEKSAIDLDAAFEINRNNTIIKSSEEANKEKIVLEQQVLTDKRFQKLVSSMEDNVLASRSAPQTRFIFYVDESSKMLLQLQDIDF